MDRGVRIAREMSEQQSQLASKALADGRAEDSDAHRYAAKTLHAVSATSGSVSDLLAFHWAADERRTAAATSGSVADECGYAATILEHLAIAIRSRVDPC